MASSPGGVEVARVSVRAVPDTSRLFEEFRADLEKIERELSIDIKASVDSAELTASAREAVAEAQALAGDIDVKARVDSSQVGELEGVLRGATSGVGSLTSGFSLLAAGGAVLSTALIPLAAVIGGLALALAAPLAITAGGLTIFGFIAGFAAKDALKQIKTIDTLKTKLDGLTKGTDTYKSTLKQLQVAQAGLPPAYKGFAGAIDKVKEAFSSIPPGVLLKPLTDAMLLLATILPKLRPVVTAVSGVLDTLVGDLNKAAQSPGFKNFVRAFADQIGPDVEAFAKIAGNVFTGLFGLFGAFNKQLSGNVLKGLENLTGRFADFGRTAGENKGLQSFVKYVKDNMPKVGALVGAAFDLIGKAFSGLAPVGSAVLDMLNGVTSSLRQMGPLAGPIAAALAGLVIPFGGPEVALVLGLAAGFKQVYNRSKPLQGLIKDLGDFIHDDLLPPIKTAAKQLLPAFKSAIKDISSTIRDNKGFLEILGKAMLTLGAAGVVAGILATAGAIRAVGKAIKLGVGFAHLFADVMISELDFIVQGFQLFEKVVLGSFGTIVDGAAKAFGFLPGIGPKVRAAQANFHAFADSVDTNLSKVHEGLVTLKANIDAVARSNPKFHIDSNTLDEIAHMHELQALQIKDKHFKITALVEQQIERAPGPGGGIGRPSGLSGGNGGGAGSGSGGGGVSPVHVDRLYASDTNDILRKTGKRLQQRAGGGVNFPPARVPSFGG